MIEQLIDDGPGGSPGKLIMARKITGQIAIHVPVFHKAIALVANQFEAIQKAIMSGNDKILYPLMKAVRKTLVTGLWPEHFHGIIASKGIWVRRFHLDRIMALERMLILYSLTHNII